MASNFISWKENFEDLFCSLQDKWKVYRGSIESLPDISDARSHGWKQFQDKGKVRFECGKCRKTWSSVKGAVIFHYRLESKGFGGEVKLWCLGQKCNVCCDKFEEPCWYDKEVERALNNLLIKVKEKFYGGPSKGVSGKQLGANMSAGHEQALCLACQKGVCGRRDDDPGIGGELFHEDDYRDDDYGEELDEEQEERDEEEYGYDEVEEEDGFDDCYDDWRDFLEEEYDTY